MPQLVPPHHSEQLKPLLLPEVERAEERARAGKLKKIPLDFARGLRCVHAGHGGLYAARRLHGT